MKKKLFVLSLMLVGVMLVGGMALADTVPSNSPHGHGFGNFGQKRGAWGIFGTVSAINGSTLSVTSKNFEPNTTSKTYTVDASNATITKDGATSSLSAIAVGDTVMVQGTINGTSVAAKIIRDGLPQNQKHPELQIQGNGQPVVGGTISAISGSTLTLTNKSNITYTIDASSAKITKNGATSSLSNISVGDNVIVQGVVNNTSITAASIIDQGASPKVSPAAGAVPSSAPGFMGRFFGGIHNFFQHLFGFF